MKGTTLLVVCILVIIVSLMSLFIGIEHTFARFERQLNQPLPTRTTGIGNCARAVPVSGWAFWPICNIVLPIICSLVAGVLGLRGHTTMRILKSVIRGVEAVGNEQVKTAIQNDALGSRVEDGLHNIVKKVTGLLK